MASTKLPARLLDTSAVPALTVTGDLTVDTNTLYVDSSDNNVGIGTTSPIRPLHVHGATSGDIVFAMTNNSTGATTSDGFNLIIEGPTPDVLLRNRENSNMRFLTNNTERVRIDASGNVGIGTSSPSTLLHQKKDSSGAYVTHLIENSNSGGYANTTYRCGTAEGGVNYAPGIFFAIGPHTNDTTTPITFRNNNATERMRIDASGDLKFNSGFGSVGTAYGVRAWVNFDGNYSSDAVIEEDGNVSSVVDNAVGDYTVNFTTAMPDGHYAVSGFGTAYASTNVVAGCIVGLHTSGTGTYIPTTKTTSAVRVVFGFGNSAYLSDIRDGSIIIVR